MRQHVDRSSRLFTDESPAHTGLGREYDGGHHVVHHGEGDYARGDAHTNTAECFNGLFKRSILGVWHHVSKQHVQRYLDEATFRWTFRRVTDAERTQVALRATDGKRLNYRPLKSSSM